MNRSAMNHKMKQTDRLKQSTTGEHVMNSLTNSRPIRLLMTVAMGLCILTSTGSTTFAQDAEPAGTEAEPLELSGVPLESTILTAEVTDGEFVTGDASLDASTHGTATVGCIEIDDVYTVNASTNREQNAFETGERFDLVVEMTNECGLEVRMLKLSIGNPAIMDLPYRELGWTDAVALGRGSNTLTFHNLAFTTEWDKIEWELVVDSYERIYETSGRTRVFHGEPAGTGPIASKPNIVGMAVSPSHKVYAWYDDGTMSVGISSDLGRHSGRLGYQTPLGKTPKDIVGMAISPDGTVTAWYQDGTVSQGSSNDLDSKRAPYPYTMP